MTKKTTPAISASPATPPTTPPTIAAVFELLPEGAVPVPVGEGKAVGDAEATVDTGITEPVDLALFKAVDSGLSKQCNKYYKGRTWKM